MTMLNARPVMNNRRVLDSATTLESRLVDRSTENMRNVMKLAHFKSHRRTARAWAIVRCGGGHSRVT